MLFSLLRNIFCNLRLSPSRYCPDSGCGCYDVAYMLRRYLLAAFLLPIVLSSIQAEQPTGITSTAKKFADALFTPPTNEEQVVTLVSLLSNEEDAYVYWPSPTKIPTVGDVAVDQLSELNKEFHSYMKVGIRNDVGELTKTGILRLAIVLRATEIDEDFLPVLIAVGLTDDDLTRLLVIEKLGSLQLDDPAILYSLLCYLQSENPVQVAFAARSLALRKYTPNKDTKDRILRYLESPIDDKSLPVSIFKERGDLRSLLLESLFQFGDLDEPTLKVLDHLKLAASDEVSYLAQILTDKLSGATEETDRLVLLAVDPSTPSRQRMDAFYALETGGRYGVALKENQMSDLLTFARNSNGSMAAITLRVIASQAPIGIDTILEEFRTSTDRIVAERASQLLEKSK